MRIGYPCINHSLDCTSGSTFRLASYSNARLVSTVEQNLTCLERILRFNKDHGILFFRIGSDLIPFASHPVNTFNWQEHFGQKFKQIGSFITAHNMRISMHPDQFVLINALDRDIVSRSIKELQYHCEVLDLLGLAADAKVQIHVGGVYGDKSAAEERFTACYLSLPYTIRKRLVIENDDRLYSLADCLSINEKTGIPILFDSFHHECLNNGEPIGDAARMAQTTWQQGDGHLMIDYSSQAPGQRRGKHAAEIDDAHFSWVFHQIRSLKADIMLEIKDKEKSALRALDIMKRSSIADLK